MPVQISNKEFLSAIFGPEFVWVCVTDFFEDPAIITTQNLRHLWQAKHFVNSSLRQYTNQYFTISLFHLSNKQKVRRRKELFKSAHCIVIDDIGEKIDINSMLDMPVPSWILETSPGSQQWGYILDPPCYEQWKVESMLNGLVNLLCPNGIDSGMLGVTRYVRLPEGYNTKYKKTVLNNGQDFKCLLHHWMPNIVTDIDSLAEAFNIDLKENQKNTFNYDQESIEQFDHPIWKVIEPREKLATNKYLISCPWINEHTEQEDSGTIIYINDNGSIGFKCHHGHCNQRTGKDFVSYLSANKPGWKKIYNDYCRVKPCPINFKRKEK